MMSVQLKIVLLTVLSTASFCLFPLDRADHQIIA
jgi:hypothetical protein